MNIEYTTQTPTYIGFHTPTTMSVEFTSYTATYPLYGRMGQPGITGSKPKVICTGQGAEIDFKGRDAKILISGY